MYLDYICQITALTSDQEERYKFSHFAKLAAIYTHLNNLIATISPLICVLQSISNKVQKELPCYHVLFLSYSRNKKWRSFFSNN